MGTYSPVRPTKSCYVCGNVIDAMAVVCPHCGVMQPGGLALMGESEKKILPVFLLCFLTGVFGVHRFYVGKKGTGLLQLLTLGGLGVWMIVDLILIAVGSFSDKDGNRITEWT
jgi:TM2 domain-containing membrane protein YozV